MRWIVLAALATPPLMLGYSAGMIWHPQATQLAVLAGLALFVAACVWRMVRLAWENRGPGEKSS